MAFHCFRGAFKNDYDDKVYCGASIVFSFTLMLS